MLQLYNTLLLPLRVVVAPWAAWRRRDPSRAREWSERRARVLPRVPPGGLWLHGASVGEARILGSVARVLGDRRPRPPLSVSAYTRTGRRQLPGPPLVDAAFFLPLDFPGLPGRLLDAVRPRALVLVETELWPNLLWESSLRGVPVAVINARLSPRRMGRYRRLGRLYRPLLSGLAAVGAQSAEDGERFRELGVPAGRVTVTGNVKYDLAPPTVDREALRRRFALADDRPVLVAGSTAAGEDGPVLDAYAEARRVVPRAFLVLAPRHPERAPEVERLARERGLRLARLSSAAAGRAGESHDGLLVDTIGELAALYALGRVAFVGGSLVPVGGHNVLEPAALGVPVLFGPHTEHVREPAAALLDAGGALRVEDGSALARRFRELLEDGGARARIAAAAAAVLESNRGALARTVALIDAIDGDHA